ncbi:MAG TPA: surface-adhesin E family protein [Nitrospiraceae bacterium]|nr:surface-adhesin E family protein [Nitrospiraceae bacterium]
MRFIIRPYRHCSMQCVASYSAAKFLRLSLAYRLGFGILGILLAYSGSAHAEWVAVSAIDKAGVIVYVDPTTSHRKGDRVTMSELIDYETIQTEKGASFLSARLQREYDCAGDLHRTLTLAQLSGNMGTGKVILITSDTQKWEPVDPGSVAKRLWRFACDKK